MKGEKWDLILKVLLLLLLLKVEPLQGYETYFLFGSLPFFFFFFSGVVCYPEDLLSVYCTNENLLCHVLYFLYSFFALKFVHTSVASRYM